MFARSALIATVAQATLCLSALAQTPLGTAFTYQGRLEDAGGPVNGVHDLRFRLYDMLTGGAPLGAIVCIDNVNVADGLVTESLDFGTEINGQERFLEIEVRADTGRDCTNAAGFIPLTPRQPLTATPYALQTRGVYVNDVGNVGIGTAAPISRLHVQTAGTSGAGIYGFAQAATGDTYGAFCQSNSTTGIGVLGSANAATGPAYGVYGQSLGTSGHGVFGRATSTTGFTYGVRGESDSVSGAGVFGWARSGNGPNIGMRGDSASTGGTGVHGLAYAITGPTTGVSGSAFSTEGRGVSGRAIASSGETYGGHFESFSPDGCGVAGIASSDTGTSSGGYFQADSSDGHAVRGLATANSGPNYGGHFRSQSPDGTGVLGWAGAASGDTTGVQGISDSPSGVAIYGRATSLNGNNFGVYAESAGTAGRGVVGLAYSNTGTTYGVIGLVESANGYAVYASGDFGASGVKSFRIDHPDDPTNKYLLHYAAESPEVINFYRGTVVLDGAGQAVVELPRYFAKINKMPTYQLTAVGAPMPMLHIAAKISESDLNAGARMEPGEAAPVCSFRIAGGAPGGEVSWRVEAVRNDRWVQQRGAPVEVEKQDLEKGTYQHPELYGQPAEAGMNYDAARDDRAKDGRSPTAAPDAEQR